MPDHAREGSPGRLLIVGAGPTGLGAGYRLRQLGYRDFRIVEPHAQVGGLSRSFRDPQGFTWDIGGHVLFSHYRYFDDLYETLMRGEYSLIDRESWVRIAGTWVPYPFQNNIRYLPPDQARRCFDGLVQAQQEVRAKARPHPAQCANFGQFIDSVFGEGIAALFMRPYNAKVWACAPELMNKAWIGERVAVVDVDRVRRNIEQELDDFAWGPNNRFRFPLSGGTGELYKRMGQLLGTGEGGHVRLGASVRRVDIDRREATLANGSVIPYDTLLSTMPLDVLCRDVLAGDVPQRLRDAASGLLHSGGHMVGVGIRRPCPSTRSWMYFPEDNCPFYRVTYLSNYSPTMTPDRARYYSLLCETSESPRKPVDPETIVEETLRGLERVGLLQPGERDDIVSTWHHYAAYSYPTPSVERDEILAEVIPWLEERGIYSRGRFGMWKYEVANTDHSVMQGVEWVDRLVLGQPEHTIGIVYRATDDGRQAAGHERPAVAGSGEKRSPPRPTAP